MRSEILRQLQSDYEQRRMNNMQEERRRLDAAIRKCPEIDMWLDERQNLIFSGMRGILGGTAVAEDIPARMQVINDRIALLLRENGFPEDWLDPVYQCRECRDMGYVGEPVREMCSSMSASSSFSSADPASTGKRSTESRLQLRSMSPFSS